MQRVYRSRIVVGTFLTSLTVLASLTIAVSPAQAYTDVDVLYARVDTGNCNRLGGTLSVVAQGNGCFLDDAADNTFFQTDVGGIALKIEFRVGVQLVAKVEFHPYGEKLWIYDTANDGDTIYVIACYPENQTPPHNGACFSLAGHTWPMSPPGTSAVVEYRIADLDEVEGAYLGFSVDDDAAGRQGLAFMYGRA